MNDYTIKNKELLNKLLWIDFALGFSTGVVGILFSTFFSRLFGLENQFIIFISIVTALYAVFAFTIVQFRFSISLIKILILLNWFWALLSCYFLYIHYEIATLLGIIFLILQIVVVGGLAFLEGNQFGKSE